MLHRTPFSQSVVCQQLWICQHFTQVLPYPIPTYPSAPSSKWTMFLSVIRPYRFKYFCNYISSSILSWPIKNPHSAIKEVRDMAVVCIGPPPFNLSTSHHCVFKSITWDKPTWDLHHNSSWGMIRIPCGIWKMIILQFRKHSVKN